MQQKSLRFHASDDIHKEKERKNGKGREKKLRKHDQFAANKRKTTEQHHYFFTKEEAPSNMPSSSSTAAMTGKAKTVYPVISLRHIDGGRVGSVRNHNGALWELIKCVSGAPQSARRCTRKSFRRAASQRPCCYKLRDKNRTHRLNPFCFLFSVWEEILRATTCSTTGDFAIVQSVKRVMHGPIWHVWV